MTLRNRLIGLSTALVTLVSGAAGSVASGVRAHSSRAGTIEHAVDVTLNDERAANGESRMRGSHILHMIAEHRARVARLHGTAYPGYDVTSDLGHFRVCFHDAREWEFAFTTTSPSRAARVVRSFFAQIPGYHADLLRPAWHEYATGVATRGHTTYLIEDFAQLC